MARTPAYPPSALGGCPCTAGHGQVCSEYRQRMSWPTPIFPHVWPAIWMGGLLAYASVDPLAQQVDVTEVAGVLMDRSDQHLAQRHRPSTAAMLI